MLKIVFLRNLIFLALFPRLPRLVGALGVWFEDHHRYLSVNPCTCLLVRWGRETFSMCSAVQLAAKTGTFCPLRV